MKKPIKSENFDSVNAVLEDFGFNCSVLKEEEDTIIVQVDCFNDVQEGIASGLIDDANI